MDTLDTEDLENTSPTPMATMDEDITDDDVLDDNDLRGLEQAHAKRARYTHDDLSGDANILLSPTKEPLTKRKKRATKKEMAEGGGMRELSTALRQRTRTLQHNYRFWYLRYFNYRDAHDLVAEFCNDPLEPDQDRPIHLRTSYQDAKQQLCQDSKNWKSVALSSTRNQVRWYMDNETVLPGQASLKNMTSENAMAKWFFDNFNKEDLINSWPWVQGIPLDYDKSTPQAQLFLRSMH